MSGPTKSTGRIEFEERFRKYLAMKKGYWVANIENINNTMIQRFSFAIKKLLSHPSFENHQKPIYGQMQSYKNATLKEIEDYKNSILVEEVFEMLQYAELKNIIDQLHKIVGVKTKDYLLSLNRTFNKTREVHLKKLELGFRSADESSEKSVKNIVSGKSGEVISDKVPAKTASACS